MKHILTITRLLLTVAFVCLPTNPQSSGGETTRYAKDGLAFEYPVGWVLTDKSTAEAQHMILSREGSSVLVMIVALRALVSDGRKLDSAVKSFKEPLIENISNKFGESGAPAARDPVCVDVGGKKAGGVRLKGMYDRQPGTAEVFSFMAGLRFTNLVYVRADKDEAQGNPAWKSIRDSLKIAKPTSVAGQTDLSSEAFLNLGGVLNGKALNLHRPEYPAFARSARAAGTVAVQVTIDESGKVVKAHAVSGHPMLREVSVDAARRAKFAPTRRCGEAVKVTGIITYNFLAR